jgi:hypothetical protein
MWAASFVMSRGGVVPEAPDGDSSAFSLSTSEGSTEPPDFQSTVAGNLS